MICPECHAEYVDGVVECSECRVRLVSSLPRVDHRENLDFVKLLSTYNQGDIALMKSILDEANVEYFFQGEFFNQVDQLIQPAVLCVRGDQAATVRELLQGFELMFLGLSGSTERPATGTE